MRTLMVLAAGLLAASLAQAAGSGFRVERLTGRLIFQEAEGAAWQEGSVGLEIGAGYCVRVLPGGGASIALGGEGSISVRGGEELCVARPDRDTKAARKRIRTFMGAVVVRG